MAQQYRQGDVFLERIGGKGALNKESGKLIPKDGNRVILAYGEVTGHAHAIVDEETELYEFPNGDRFLFTENGISLVHEEHGTIELPAGVFKVTIQKEYTEDGSFVQVMD